jgi:hypothetical protein
MSTKEVTSMKFVCLIVANQAGSITQDTVIAAMCYMVCILLAISIPHMAEMVRNVLKQRKKNLFCYFSIR